MRRRGFTLIELLVGSAVMLIVLTGAMSVLLAASAQHRRGLEKANLERACTLLIGQMEAELRQAGLGVPKGSGPGGARFPAAILAANPTDLTFIADLARPNSSFNGFSQVADAQSALAPAGVAVLNELNGACDVDAAAGRCSTDTATLLFAPSGTDCASSSGARTCPWALNKYQPGENVILANGAGDWLLDQLDSPHFGTIGTRKALKLVGGRPAPFFDNLPNRGFVSTPDRVSYALAVGTVQRRQCWDPMGPALPALTAAGLLALGCAAPDGTPWEVRARDVAALAFEYRDAADAIIPAPVPAASLRRISRVVINLTLQRAVGTGLVTATATGTASVRE